MTDKQQPAQFDWATELSDAQGHVTLSEQEAKEIGARLRSMGEKLKVYEDLGDAADDMQLLRMGYAAARLEIESLQARIKTMAEERADELMVAHLDGRSQAAQQPAPSAAVALSDDLRDRLVAISGAVADQDDRAAQAMLREILKAPQPSPTPQADSVLEDAARYRWLRENWFTMTSNYQRRITFKVGEPRWSGITEEELDAAIDAARKQGANHD